MPSWLDELLSDTSIPVLIVLTALAIGAVKTWPWLRKVVRFLDALIGDDKNPGLLERVNGLEGRVDRIHHEVTPNSGGSMKDAVARTEQTLNSVATDLEAVKQKLDRDHERISDLEDTATRPPWAPPPGHN